MLTSNLDSNKSNERLEKMQLYLASPEEDELVKLSQKLSPNNRFTQDQDLLGAKIEKDKFTAEYNTTFTKKEIFAECRKYNLGLIQAKDYTGEYSMDFLKKLQKFFEEKNIATSDRDYSTEVYILAPGKSDVSDSDIRYPAQDPLMFYRVKEGYFVLIDGSREYVNLFNWWQGLKHYHSLSCRGIYILENYVAIVALMSLVLWTVPWHLNPFVLIFSFFGSFLGMIIRMGVKDSKGSDAFEHGNSYFNKYKYRS